MRSLREQHPNIQFRYDTITVADDGSLLPQEQRYTRAVNCINLALKDPWVKTIIIDSLSSLCDFLIDHIVASKDGTKAKEMTISDWIPFRMMLSRLVTNLRATHRYLIVTSHEENVKDEVTGQIITRTNMPSKLADNFGGFFSDVWRTEVDEIGGKIIYLVRSAPTVRIPAIGNSLGLPPKFVFEWSKLAPYFEKNN